MAMFSPHDLLRMVGFSSEINLNFTPRSSRSGFQEISTPRIDPSGPPEAENYDFGPRAPRADIPTSETAALWSEIWISGAPRSAISHTPSASPPQELANN